MENAICWECVEDRYLKDIIRDKGESQTCSVCEKERKAFTLDDLAEVLGPIIQENFLPGEEVKRFGEEDADDWWDQEGDPLSHVVQEVLGQYFDFNDEIVDAIVDSEYVDVSDGDIAFFETTAKYVERRVSPYRYIEEWDFALKQLKHERRFFSSSAGTLFQELFHGIEDMQTWNPEKRKAESVVIHQPEGSELFRARICDSMAALKDAFTDPFKYVGPPPPERARAGRMNVEGVAVFYGTTDRDTCLAEMRPFLGGDSAVIAVRTTKPLRLLDFTRIEKSYRPLSYFQSDFTEQAEKNAFLRRLGSLISKPIVPGKESDYLITQTMSEYLAHIHEKPFDGLLFKSVQRQAGTNVVLFPKPDLTGEQISNNFPLNYVDKSIKLFSTEMIKYEHTERTVDLVDGEVRIYDEHFDDSDN